MYMAVCLYLGSANGPRSGWSTAVYKLALHPLNIRFATKMGLAKPSKPSKPSQTKPTPGFPNDWSTKTLTLDVLCFQ